MLYVQKANNGEQLTALALAIIAVHLIIGITFMFSTKILSVIKDSGVTLLARIAGLLLSAIAVEMIVSAIKSFFSIS
jgi:multiple antibiotic resistance protein